jgi:hypothetical protein
MREETLCEILVARRTQLPDETATTMAFAGTYTLGTYVTAGFISSLHLASLRVDTRTVLLRLSRLTARRARIRLERSRILLDLLCQNQLGQYTGGTTVLFSYQKPQSGRTN